MKTYKPFMDLARSDRRTYNTLLGIAEGDKKRMKRLVEKLESNFETFVDAITIANHTSIDAYHLYKLIMKQSYEEKDNRGRIATRRVDGTLSTGPATREIYELKDEAIKNLEKKRRAA